jgi:PTS system cellobiose-specific IIB component
MLLLTQHGMNEKEGAAMRVLVVCGAGASSTFVAMWLRKAAAARGLDVIASASSDTELDELAADSDVVLIGPHLADRFDDLAQRVRARGASAVLVPEQIITTRDGAAALDLALAAAAPDNTALDNSAPVNATPINTAPDTMQQEKSNG